jgi:malonyl-CoA O-methyltransferase
MPPQIRLNQPGYPPMAGIRHNRSHAQRRLAPWRKTPAEAGDVIRPTGDSSESQGGLLARSASALRRRAAYAWRRLTEGERGLAVPAAMNWLARQTGHGGLATTPDDPLLCPGLSGAALSTFAAYGQIELARSCAAWLLSTQLADGAFPDAGLRNASPFNTSQAIQGLLALGDELPGGQEPIERASDFLVSCIDAAGRIAPTDRNGGAAELWAAPNFSVSCLPALASAARRCERVDWLSAVERATEYALRSFDFCHWTGPLHMFAPPLEALLQLGQRDLVREALVLPAALQRRDGSLPTTPEARWVSSAGLAHLATIWYRLHERESADRALACLRRRQRPSGGFLGSWGREASLHPNRETAWTVKHFLDASLLQVYVAFSSLDEGQPTEIASGDGRLSAVRNWMNRLGPGPAVADVGCGPGRYLQQLWRAYPGTRLTGIDPSLRWLAHLPASAEGRRGSLLRIPAAEGEFDGAFAIESLEHSLLPRQAVRELCRIVRPGGRVLIIDKRLSKQPLSDHEPWEQWFAPEEVAAWLGEACDEVSVTEISHGRHSQPTGLFLCWQGRRFVA